MASTSLITDLSLIRDSVTGTRASINFPAVKIQATQLYPSGIRKRKVVVKAMGQSQPKYKGTQMREKQLTELIEKKVIEAREVCEGDEKSAECKVAWDEVEEVSQAKAHLRRKLDLEKRDPLESYCLENPETDECRIYDD